MEERDEDMQENVLIIEEKEDIDVQGNVNILIFLRL
jgi:hypothetical protein